MIVVLPFCQKDYPAANRLLHWIFDLGGAKNYDCLLIADCGTQWSDCLVALETANKAFRKASIITNKFPADGWIAGANSLFFEAAERIQRNEQCPWLWLEPDCVPLKPDWLDRINEEYQRCGKPFMGHIYNSQLLNLPRENLSGIAVYPEDAYSRLKPWRDSPLPFDIAIAYKTVPEAHNTALIQHIWGENDLAPTFADNRTIGSPMNTMMVGEISPHAVLFHRCKDSSLMRLLKKKLFPWMPADDIPPCFIQLGRYGDLILLLPAFKEWHDRMGVPPYVMVSKEFADVLEGVSYVSPIITRLHWHNQLGEAVKQAKASYPNVVVTQLHGVGWKTEPDDLESFSLSMWRRTGFLELYHERLPVFDKRQPFLERMLVKHHHTKPKPLLLVNYNSWTSPLGSELTLHRLVQAFGSQFDVVNTSAIRAKRVFDLLGLMEAAAGMITVDTMTLHLASACKIPYIAIVRDDRQSGSIPKGNCELKIGYSQVEKRLNDIITVLNRWATKAP